MLLFGKYCQKDVCNGVDSCCNVFCRNAINDVQGEYLQQREYGSIPSFARTQRVHGSHSGASSSGATSSGSGGTGLEATGHDSDSYTMTDEIEGQSGQPHIYSILPADVSNETCLYLIKQRLDHLHPSQRDYVSAQLLHEDCLYLKKLIGLFNQLESVQNIQALKW